MPTGYNTFINYNNETWFINKYFRQGYQAGLTLMCSRYDCVGVVDVTEIIIKRTYGAAVGDMYGNPAQFHLDYTQDGYSSLPCETKYQQYSAPVLIRANEVGNGFWFDDYVHAYAQQKKAWDDFVGDLGGNHAIFCDTAVVASSGKKYNLMMFKTPLTADSAAHKAVIFYLHISQ